jgi:hypothetical protein
MTHHGYRYAVGASARLSTVLVDNVCARGSKTLSRRKKKSLRKLLYYAAKRDPQGDRGVARVRVLFMPYCINIQLGYDYAEYFKVVCFFTS